MCWEQWRHRVSCTYILWSVIYSVISHFTDQNDWQVPLHEEEGKAEVEVEEEAVESFR